MFLWDFTGKCRKGGTGGNGKKRASPRQKGKATEKFEARLGLLGAEAQKREKGG